MNKMISLKNRLKAHPEYWYVLFLPAYLICFFLVELLVPSGSDYWVSYLPMDDQIPFLEIFVIPYCMWYPLLVFVGLFLLFRDVPQFKKYMQFLIISFFFTLIFCVVFPNGQDLRPAEFPRDNVFTRLLACLYAADTNTNVLPSIHVIGSIAAAIATVRSKAMRRYRPYVVVLAVLISASTVFVKQHSILDVYAGIAASIPIYFLLYRRKKKA